MTENSLDRVKGLVPAIDNRSRVGTLRATACKLRVQYPGAIYHVMNRGDRREAVFRDDGDRQRFLDTLGEACGKAGWQVHALCLMDHHFHLVVETPRGDLVAGMKWLLGTYTSRFNRRHRLFGHLFSGRYKALIVDGSGDGNLMTVCDDVHLNPARAEWVRPEDALSVYGWSSWPPYLANRSKGDPGKVATARRLRQETTMTLKWMAQRLAMGSASMVSHCLRFR